MFDISKDFVYLIDFPNGAVEILQYRIGKDIDAATLGVGANINYLP